LGGTQFESELSYWLFLRIFTFSNSKLHRVVLKLENKGAYLDSYEKLHIYKAAKQGSIINETLFNQSNALFELL
jgi:hypothetical protein